MDVLVLLTLATVVWSLFANLVLGDRGYVVRNLVLTGALVAVALGAGWEAGDLGLAAEDLGEGFRWGRGAVLAAAFVIALAAGLADHVALARRLLADRRAALPLPALVHAVLVRIPLGTVVFEEVLFRGVVLGAAMRVLPLTGAVAWQSVAFGLWHVAPTIVALRENDVDPASATGWPTIVGAVAVTTIAGVGFALLTLGTGSLVAPMLTHWALNAFGLLAAAVTQATDEPRGGSTAPS
jgi:uncharacterized protein